MKAEMSSRSILIVDDEADLLQTINDYLEISDQSLTVYTARNGVEALEKLREHAVSLLITDVMMPEMNGLTLMSHVMNEYPTIPCIVFSAYGNPELEAKLGNLGCLQFFDKPFDLDKLYRKITEIFEQSESTGYINGLTLESFLQLLSMEQKTGIVEILHRTSGNRGYIFFAEGILLDARFQTHEGEQALFDILSLEKADMSISLHFQSVQREKRIQRSLTHLIIESARLKDERLRGDGPGDGDLLFNLGSHEDSVGDDSFEFDLQPLPSGTSGTASGAVTITAGDAQAKNDESTLVSKDTSGSAASGPLQPQTSPPMKPATDFWAVYGKDALTGAVRFTRAIPVRHIPEKQPEPTPATATAPSPPVASPTVKTANVAPATAGVARPAVVRTEQSARAELQERIMIEFSSLDGVILAMLVDQKGDIVTSRGKKIRKDPRELGHASVQILEGVHRMAARMKYRQCTIVTIEYLRQIIVSKPFKDFLLVLVVSDEKALGMVRFNLQKHFPQKGGGLSL